MSLNHANTLTKTVGQSVLVKTNKMIKITDGWRKKKIQITVKEQIKHFEMRCS